MFICLPRLNQFTVMVNIFRVSVNQFAVSINQFTVRVNELREMFNKTYTTGTISRVCRHRKSLNKIDNPIATHLTYVNVEHS